MTESNKQTNPLGSLALSVAPEDYVINKAKIAEAKALISAYEEMNEAGKQSHDEFARELEQKIRDGEEARKLLEQLRSQSTVQVPPLLPIQRPSIEYPSSTSRIEEVSSYDPGSGHPQQVQYQQYQGTTSNQQTHNSVPQATVQPPGSNPYQQLSSQQWASENANGGQSQQNPYRLYSQYWQYWQQNGSSNATPFGFPSTVRPQQQSAGQDQGKHDNYSRPIAPTQEQRRVQSRQEPLYHGNTGSNQRYAATSTPQVQVYLSPQTMPAQAPGLSNYAAHTTRPPQFAQQSTSTQKTYPEAAFNQNQATASGTTFPRPSPHEATNTANQSQPPATTVVASQPVALGPQPNASSSDNLHSSSNSALFGRPTNSVPAVVSTSPNPMLKNFQNNPNGDGTSISNSSTTSGAQPLRLMVPTALPSMHLNPIQYIREFREVIKNWELRVPPNSYFDHPSNSFTVFKDPNGLTRVLVHGGGQSLMWNGDFDQFCDHWQQRQNANPASGSQQPFVTQTVSANLQSDPSSKQSRSAPPMSMHTRGDTSFNTQKAIPSTAPKPIPSTIPSAVHKADGSIVRTAPSFSRFQSATSISEVQPLKDPQTGVKQTPSTMSTSMQNQGALQTATLSTSQKSISPISQIQLSTPSSSATGRPLPPSTAHTLPSISNPETPSRQLSTIINGVPRSAKQADRKVLASHILFGLGKRSREPDMSPTALTEPKRKKHAQQATGEVGVAFSLSTSHAIGQTAQAVQNSNVPLTPTRALAAQHTTYTPPVHPQETQQTSQASSSTSSNVALEIPVTNQVATAASTTIPEVSKTSGQTPLSLEDASIVQAALLGEQEVQVPISIVHLDSQQGVISDNRLINASGSSVPQARAASVPPATSSPIPLTAPVALLSSENTTQPVASHILKPPQIDGLAIPQRSFIDVTSPVPSPLHSMAPTSADMPQKNQPLFLPSPESSPGIDANNDVSITGAQSANAANPSFGEFDLWKSSSFAKKKNRAYVLAPPRPKYLVKYLQLEERKMSRAFLKRIRMTSKNSVSTPGAGEEDFDNALESHSPSYPYEQQAVQLACSRLQELSCKWDGCLTKINSVDALIRHLNQQHKPPSASHGNRQSFLCRWTQCGRRCNRRERHLEKHAYFPLNCPYEDCDESFRSAPPLWKHMRAEHEDDTLKPSAQPFYPKLEPPATIPGVIPSYMITTMRVDPYNISSARHAITGPWVLRNIAGLERERLARQKSRKSIRGDLISDEDASNDYDFLTVHPIRYSSMLSQPVDMNFEDLNSENISKMVDEGLILWGYEEESASEPASPSLIENPERHHVGSDSPTFGYREHRNEDDGNLDLVFSPYPSVN